MNVRGPSRFMLHEYRCYVPRLDTEAFYEAETAAKARYKCLRAIWNAGYSRHARPGDSVFGDNTFGFKDIQTRLAYVGEWVAERARRREGAA